MFPDGANAVDEVLCAAVAQVVAVDAGDHHVAKPQRGDRPGEIDRLLGVERIGPAVPDVAERAAARALVAHDHERRSALAEALADVRARGLLADRVQPVVAQDALDVVEARACARRLHADPFGLAERRGRDELDRDACRLGGALLLVGHRAHGSRV
jgi:hypothetical protein